MSDKVVLSRRKWLLGMAKRTAAHVAEAAVERIPEPLISGGFSAELGGDLAAGGGLAAGLAEAGAAAAIEPEPTYFPLALVLHKELCIAHLGIDCGACARLCPDGVKALWLERNRPVIDPAACVDCAECVRACPTSPRAVDLVDVLPDTTAAGDTNGVAE